MPTGLQDPYGQAFNRALGIVKDWFAQQARQAVFARFPDYAPLDALAQIGLERQIDQGLDVQLSVPETAPAYAARLVDAWNIWRLGGTAWGMLKAFAAQGFFPQLACQNGLIYSVNMALVLSITQGPVLTLQDPGWAQFFVWFQTKPTSWTSPVSPPTTSTVPSIDEIRKVRRAIIKRWQPAWTRNMDIAVPTSGAGGILGAPGITLGMGGLVLGETVTWYGPNDYLTLGFPPGRNLGSGFNLGMQE
jgi:hypothetical protein